MMRMEFVSTRDNNDFLRLVAVAYARHCTRTCGRTPRVVSDRKTSDQRKSLTFEDEAGGHSQTCTKLWDAARSFFFDEYHGTRKTVMVIGVVR